MDKISICNTWNKNIPT